jgi:pilus assembly protein Flp/PilA
MGYPAWGDRGRYLPYNWVAPGSIGTSAARGVPGVQSIAVGLVIRSRQRGIMSVVARLISAIRRDDEGQGLAEYALILALIAIVAIIALIFLGGRVSQILSDVGNSV